MFSTALIFVGFDGIRLIILATCGAVTYDCFLTPPHLVSLYLLLHCLIRNFVSGFCLSLDDVKAWLLVSQYLLINLVTLKTIFVVVL